MFSFLFFVFFFHFYLFNFDLFCFVFYQKQVIAKWLWKQSLGILRRIWVSWGNYFGRDVINQMKPNGVYNTFQYARTVVVTSTIWKIIILNLYNYLYDILSNSWHCIRFVLVKIYKPSFYMYPNRVVNCVTVKRIE